MPPEKRELHGYWSVSPFSTKATDKPNSQALTPALKPAKPPPMMIRSYFFVSMMSFDETVLTCAYSLHCKPLFSQKLRPASIGIAPLRRNSDSIGEVAFLWPIDHFWTH
jgi:hypothetical protein